jgi:hypothetical protein
MQYEDEDDLGEAAPPLNWPPPAPIPTDKRDLEGLREVRDRLKREVTEAEGVPLSPLLAEGDPDEGEEDAA